MNSSVLKYPNKSHRKKVRIPEYNERLAEFIGLMIGDGGINNPWQVNISLNSDKDKRYSLYISDLCRKLFGVKPAIRKRVASSNLIVSLASTSIVNFLVENGLPRGNKLAAGIIIPEWIFRDKKFRIACVRGLVDTDGCIYIHKHQSKYGKVYENIGLNFASYSPELIFQVYDILLDNNFSPIIHKSGKQLYLYQAAEVERYLKVFGSSNERIKSGYKKWRDARVV